MEQSAPRILLLDSLKGRRITVTTHNIKIGRVMVMNPVKLSGAEDIAALSDTLPGFDAASRLFLLAPSGIPVDVLGLPSEATQWGGVVKVQKISVE